MALVNAPKSSGEAAATPSSAPQGNAYTAVTPARKGKKRRGKSTTARDSQMQVDSTRNPESGPGPGASTLPTTPTPAKKPPSKPQNSTQTQSAAPKASDIKAKGPVAAAARIEASADNYVTSPGSGDNKMPAPPWRDRRSANSTPRHNRVRGPPYGGGAPEYVGNNNASSSSGSQNHAAPRHLLQQQQSLEADLNNLLTLEQKGELALLVAKIIDEMKTRLEFPFTRETRSATAVVASAPDPPTLPAKKQRQQQQLLIDRGGGSGNEPQGKSTSSGIGNGIVRFATDLVPRKWRILGLPDGSQRDRPRPTTSSSTESQELSAASTTTTSGDGTNTPNDFDAPSFTSGTAGGSDSDSTMSNADTTVTKPKPRVLRLSANPPTLVTIPPNLLELHKELLAAFSKWEATVTKRLGDINVNPQGALQRSQSYPGSVPLVSQTRGAVGSSKAVAAAQKPHVVRSVEMIERYPPTKTSLSSLAYEKRALLLHTMLLLSLSLENYSAYSRVFLLRLASSLKIPFYVLAEDEVRVAKGLSQIAKNLSAEEYAQKKLEENKASRRWKIGLASAAGAAVIGVTGGLAAPLVAAGIGTVLGGIGLGSTAAAGLLGTMAESSLVVGGLFGLYGGRASGKTMEHYARDVQDFAFLPLSDPQSPTTLVGSASGFDSRSYISRPTNAKNNPATVATGGGTSSASGTGGNTTPDEAAPTGPIERPEGACYSARDVPPADRRLRMVLAISGWLAKEEDVVAPWQCLKGARQTEAYALRWELDALLKMGSALETVLRSAAWGMAKKEIVSRTSLMQAMWPIGLLKVSKIIDNPWSIGLVRADKTGGVLAEAIANKVQGERAVTLIGYGLGARAIYACLMNLAERRIFGLVESVVLMGCPCPADEGVWTTLRSVVAGRLVNVYSENDYILAFLYRTASVQFGIAGLQPVLRAGDVENVNASDLVGGHLRYQYVVGSILRELQWEDLDLEQVDKDEEHLKDIVEHEELLEQQEKTRHHHHLQMDGAAGPRATFPGPGQGVRAEPVVPQPQPQPQPQHLPQHHQHREQYAPNQPYQPCQQYQPYHEQRQVAPNGNHDGSRTTSYSANRNGNHGGHPNGNPNGSGGRTTLEITDDAFLHFENMRISD